MNDRPLPTAQQRAFLSLARHAPPVPQPGSGRTFDRFSRIRACSRANPSFGRLVEAHFDAAAILTEAGIAPPERQALAVWASGPSDAVRLERVNGSNVLCGSRSFCGGGIVVDAALLTAGAVTGEQLVLVDLNTPGIAVDPGTWPSSAFEDAGVCTVTFDRVFVDDAALVGPTNWYGSRGGFWMGAAGIAAAWAGIADALLNHYSTLRHRNDDVRSIATGGIMASLWAVDAALATAATKFDEIGLGGDKAELKRHALSCRHTVRAQIESAMLWFDHEAGPAPLISNPDLARCRSELDLALAQNHGLRDLLALATP